MRKENGMARPRTVPATGPSDQMPHGPIPDAASAAAVFSTSRTTKQVWWSVLESVICIRASEVED
jgi:hypothetical protein